MSVDIERYDGGRWVNPVELEAIYSREAYARFGFTDVLVCSFSAKGRHKGLFFGSGAVVPMHPGLPDDLTPELQFLRNKKEPGFYDAWCLAEDLCLDLWETETVLIKTRVNIQFAEIFGDGERPASEVRRDIQEFGVPSHEVDWMLRFDALVTTAPENWGNHRRYQLQRLEPDESVPVTWRETYAECAGSDLWDRGLSRLQDLSNLQSYRLILNCL